MSLALTAYTASSAVGHGRAALLDALRAGRSGLKACDFETAALATWMGEVPGVDEVALPPGLAAYDCRNNRLALLGLRADGFED
ncbi:MAG TPA: beta-ketoacyl-[acyl-carrier-protein] synthase II, partial [Ottowia sp.]|nr:beta-ketoacyl-[acyl-carrier-protein] synthase II [Ottowia sp.]